jgi:tetratricopeptide (TPR) repeat protein
MSLADKEKSEKAISYKILYNWGITLRRVGNDDLTQDNLQKSIEYLQLATQAKPNEPAAHNNLGLSLFEKELFHDANKAFDRAI